MQIILITFILKMFDNTLNTAKTIALNKEKYMLSAFFNAFATFFYLIAVIQLTKNSSMLGIISMCLATFLGTYLPGIIFKKIEKEKLYIYDITSDTFESGKDFSDLIRKENIAIKTIAVYNSDMKKVLSSKIFCSTKEESKIVENLIPTNFKYNIIIPIE